MNFINLLIILLFASIIPGIIGITKASLVGRKSPSIWQPIYDIIRLFRKGSVYSSTTTIIFRLAPVVYISTLLLGMFLIPFANYQPLLSFDGNFVFFAYMLALGKFFMIIGAMDTGSGFEGMGANREALFSMLIEPAFFVIIGSLALFTDNVSFFDLFNNLFYASDLSFLAGLIGTYVLFHISMIENSRMPVDDPKTHLELTMIHEVMVLDYSGFDLALIQTGNAIKFGIYAAFIGNFLIPFAIPLHFKILCYAGIAVLFSIGVGFAETFSARYKMAKNPQWIISVLSISLILFITVLILTQKMY